ncbi:MAG: M48 family metalloprotease [Proteobacteria bacterium]|nr:M48 family metalloprotease [Pseudomonadota bacterium]
MARKDKFTLTVIGILLLSLMACGPKAPKRPHIKIATSVKNEELSSSKPEGKNTKVTEFLTDSDLDAITQLVLPFQKIEEEDYFAKIPLPVYPGLKKLVEFMQRTVDQASELKPLAPGRSFKVNIMDTLFSNAFADGNQNIVLLAPGIQTVDAELLLPILCHEMAHSFRNHAVKKAGKGSEKSQISDKAKNDYFNSQYNENTNVYTHNATAWKKMIAVVLDNLDKEELIMDNHLESEADVLGGMICAELGLDPALFLKGFSRMDEGFKTPSSNIPKNSLPADLADGAHFIIGPLDLSSYVFAVEELSDHPKTEDRIAQIKKFLPRIQTHFNANSTLAQDWLNTMPALIEEARKDLNAFNQAPRKLRLP